MVDRYSRQIIFPGIGGEGQKKLAGSTVTIIGCGALGTVSVTALVRAGIGKIRIVDRDFIELHNLQRQVLFDEDDIKQQLPKAIAAERHLKKVNSVIDIEGIVADVNYTNIEEFVRSADVVVDGLDNLETRLLINDACLKHNVPWVYGGAISSTGMTMTIVPGKTPCWQCFCPGLLNPGTIDTCDTGGVISPAPMVIGSLQAAEVLKLLVGAEEVNRDIIFIDVWRGTFQKLKINPRPDCPACRGEYEFLNGKAGLRTTTMCGQNAVQIWNPGSTGAPLEQLAERLKAVGEVTYSPFMIRFTVDGREMVIFPDGRTIVRDTGDEALARGLYAKYIGA